MAESQLLTSLFSPKDAALNLYREGKNLVAIVKITKYSGIYGKVFGIA